VIALDEEALPEETTETTETTRREITVTIEPVTARPLDVTTGQSPGTLGLLGLLWSFDSRDALGLHVDSRVCL